MWICPSVTRKTRRGSSILVSFSQVVKPVRSLPLKSETASFGATGSAADMGRAKARETNAKPRRVMERTPAGSAMIPAGAGAVLPDSDSVDRGRPGRTTYAARGRTNGSDRVPHADALRPGRPRSTEE